MYDQSKLSELIRFARVEAGLDVYPGDGEWTRLFSGVVGPEGRVYSFVVTVSSFVRNAGDVRRSYLLVPAGSSVSVSDLESENTAAICKSILDARGYHPAASLADAELLISFDYRVEGPVERVTVDRYRRGWRTDELAPNYTRRALVRACDAAPYRKNGQLDQVWITQL